MRIGSHEYANEADDYDDVPKPAQSLGTPVPRQKILMRSVEFTYFLYFVSHSLVTDEYISALQVLSLLLLVTAYADLKILK